MVAVAAVRLAIETRHPPAGCIHHSDRGMQCAAQEYMDDLKAVGLLIVWQEEVILTTMLRQKALLKP